jgi:hypothetical protein
MREPTAWALLRAALRARRDDGALLPGQRAVLRTFLGVRDDDASGAFGALGRLLPRRGTGRTGDA